MSDILLGWPVQMYAVKLFASSSRAYGQTEGGILLLLAVVCLAVFCYLSGEPRRRERAFRQQVKACALHAQDIIQGLRSKLEILGRHDRALESGLNTLVDLSVIADQIITLMNTRTEDLDIRKCERLSRALQEGIARFRAGWPQL
ncbi:MAG TPA: hypothetical protein PKL83_01545 [bacterium]|nr:hypothetical protein [bacterium]